MSVEEKIDEKILEINESIRSGDLLVQLLDDNPVVTNLINKLFTKQSIRMGIVLSMLLSGIFELVNALTIMLNLTYQGWLVSGLAFTFLGAFFTIRSYRR